MPKYNILGIGVDFPFDAYQPQLIYMEKVILSLQKVRKQKKFAFRFWDFLAFCPFSTIQLCFLLWETLLYIISYSRKPPKLHLNRQFFQTFFSRFLCKRFMAQYDF